MKDLSYHGRVLKNLFPQIRFSNFLKKGRLMEKTDKAFKELVFLIRTLRGEGGCPWDRKQTIETLKHYLHQEFQELMEALDEKSPEKTQEEMGDLIFLLLFCAEIARDEGDFSIGDVLENVKKKMVGRLSRIVRRMAAGSGLAGWMMAVAPKKRGKARLFIRP